jgi:fibronectin-binding autotransporter adhesin
MRPTEWSEEMGKRNAGVLGRVFLLPGVFAVAFVAGGSVSTAATNYVWQPLTVGDASGSWAVDANWSPAGPFAGTDNTADFNTKNITVDSVVTLDGDQTVGTIKFGDTTTATAASWTLNAGSGGKLILATTVGAPLITVNSLGTGKIVTINAVVDGTQGFTKNGGGTLALTNTGNSFSGTTAINQGALRFVSGSLGSGAISFGGTGQLVWETGNTQDISNRTLTGAIDVTMSQNVTFANAIGAVGSSFTKRGSGTLTLTTAAGWNGTTNAAGGILAISNANQISAAALSFNGAGLSVTNNLVLNNTVTFASDSSMSGPGTLTFGGNFTNGGGDRKLTNNLTSGSLTLSGNIYLSESTTVSRTFRLQVNTASITTISGVIANVNGSGVAGNISVNPDGAGGALVISGNSNTFTGTTTVNNGILRINSSNGTALATSSLVTMGTSSTARLDLAGTSQSIKALSGGSTGNNGAVINSIAATTSTLSITAGGGSYAGNIQNGTGTMALAKTGSGTQTLTGGNTYSGGTAITGGRIVVSGNGRLGTGNVTVGSLGELELQNSTAIGNGATLSIDLAASPNVVLATGVNELVGKLILGGVAFTSGTFGATGSGAINIRDDYFSGSGIVTVPEPSTIGFLAVGGLLAMRRRRAK